MSENYCQNNAKSIHPFDGVNISISCPQSLMRIGGPIYLFSPDFKTIFDNTIIPIINQQFKEDLISNFSKFNIKDYPYHYSDYTLNMIEEIKDKEIWRNKVYKIREIKNDSNSFMRSIMFFYLENIILNKDIDSMKKFMIQFNEIVSIFQSENNKYNKEKIIHILYILLDCLNEGNIDKAYNFLLKSFLFISKFDFSLNYFMRKLISDYISHNQNAYLSEEEPVKIIELIPQKYKINQNGNIQLLDEFLKDLINMEYKIPNNEIYSEIIPYIFHYDLSVIIYDKNNKEINEIKYKYKANNNLILNLIYYEQDNSFGIYYTKEFFEKFKINLEQMNFKLNKMSVINEINEKFFLGYMNFLINYDKKKFTNGKKENIINSIYNLPYKKGDNNKEILLGDEIKKLGLDIEELFQKNKQKLCFICNQIIDNNMNIITLPCKCRICSLHCFEKYINEIDYKNDKVLYHDEVVIFPMSKCFCGHKYKLKEFEELKKEIVKFDQGNYISIIDQTIKNNLIWKCVLCEEIFSNKGEFIELNLIDQKRHLLCEKCKKKKNINIENNNSDPVEFYCLFCNSKHYIKPDLNCIII
jgi:hypothetical protein